MNYRQAALADYNELSLLERQQPRAAQWGESSWKTELTNPAACVWCAQEDDKIVGFVALRWAADVGEIVNVAVSPKYCRRGIGEELLCRCLMWGTGCGVKQITLEVGATNAPAIALYEKLGFAKVGLRKNFYQNNEDAFIFKLSL